MALQVPPSLSAAYDSLHQISRLFEERLEIEANYLGQLERWNATAHLVPPEDPLFCTIKALLETTDEDIRNRHLEEDSLRRKLDNVNRAVESFDDIFDPIRNEETAIPEYERRAEQSRMEAKARYLDWMNAEDEKSGLAFRFRKNVLRRDYRQAFDKANRSLREDIDKLNRARSSFKDHIFQDSGRLVVHYQDVVKEIRSLIASFAEEQQSIAAALNTLGARLLHATNSISSSSLAGQFIEVFQNEAGSMKPEKAIYCVLHQQDEFPHLQHHNKVFGFSFSQHTCPRETQLVMSLFKVSLFQPYGGPPVAAIEPEFSKVDDIEKNWGIDLARDQSLILSLLKQPVTPTRALLESFPAPILSRTEVSRYSLQSHPGELVGPAGIPSIDEMHLLAVASVHGRPQGEILQTIHTWVLLYPKLGSVWWEKVRFLLTREARWLETYFEILLERYNDYVTLLGKVSVVQAP